MSNIVLQVMQIHGGGSGIGTFAIQIAKAKDVKCSSLLVSNIMYETYVFLSFLHRILSSNGMYKLSCQKA
jgi:hypothetical protein